MGKITELISVE